MAITPSRQRNAVSEGIALGLLMCDRNALPWDKVGIDLSFEGAWSSWLYRHHCPQVDTDIRQALDGVWAVTGAEERRHTFNLFWLTDGPELVIYPRPVWSDGEATSTRPHMDRRQRPSRRPA